MLKNIDLLPFFGPLLALLRSRKFLVAIITIGLDALIAYEPRLEPVRAELLAIFTLVGSMLIGAIAYEDGKASGG